MHRYRVALACMAVVVIMALLIPLVGCGGGGPTVPCKISSLTGDVQVSRSGSTESVKATEGMELAVGDTITTGSDGSVNLTFFDDSLMEIKANSEILVKELSTASTGSTSVSLKQNIGRTINRVNKLIDSGSRYEVETASATTVVKGTIFEVLVLQNGDTTVKSEEGSVLFTASGVTVTVNQGFLSSASVGGTPSTPTPTPTATATPAETPASTPTISSTPTATATPAETPASTPTPTSTQPTPNGAIPQELIGVWKSDCGVHVGNQSRTIAWTLKGSTLQMAYDIWDSDSSCGDPSKKILDSVTTWETDLITQNTNGSYQVTVIVIAETVTVLTQSWVAWANDINFYEYNDWQVGVSKDVLGRLMEPGASSPEPTKGTQYDLPLQVDGDKLSIDLPGLNGIIFTKQVALPQELIGVWKSDCGVHVGNPFGTIAWTIEDSMLRMVYTVWNDPSCIDSSKKFEDFVMTWEPNLVTQNTDGSYTVTATLVAETAAYLTEDGVALANDMNFYEYNDWQAGISKDVSGKIREPGASPEPNRGTQSDLLLKLDGDKLSIDIPGLSGIIYTKQ